MGESPKLADGETRPLGAVPMDAWRCSRGEVAVSRGVFAREKSATSNVAVRAWVDLECPPGLRNEATVRRVARARARASAARSWDGDTLRVPANHLQGQPGGS